ncbi:hypothetical protein [Hymenobacter norwichensis]|uniref:hypothetical protein n=1 Tax=Hymenobacter norwichensis TaxID=223903 RepID=UPI0003B7080C|nr:hypothetical protein [Hymenobacter norwichensis]
MQFVEVHNEAQVLVHAGLSQQKATTKQRLEQALTEIYKQYQGTAGFRRFGRATVVNAYLFTSEELGRKGPSAPIGWLWKGPKDAESNMSIDEVMLADDVRAWDA